MLTRTETQPAAGQQRHTRSRVTAWWIGALAAGNWRWVGTFLRLIVALILLVCVTTQYVAHIDVTLHP